MLDLARPLQSVEGLVLYRDHADPGLVYYLPDEIGLAVGRDGEPDLLQQIFFPDEAVTGSADVSTAVGSILSLGVTCVVSRQRLERARSALGAGTRLVMPPWEDGTVDLLLLDAPTGAVGSSPGGAERAVRSVAGSRRPSLSDGTLAGLFHARLDRVGTALVAASLTGGAADTSGILYDLSYSALAPEIALRMSADLDACAEAIRAGLGVQVYYVGADVSATFATMRENGTITVDLISPVADAEAQKLVDQAVQDFYDTLMRELFRPTLAPAEMAGMPTGSGTVSAAPVRLSFAYSRGERSRTVSVDYRKRSAIRRTHNPAAHLRTLGTLVDPARRVQRVPLSAAWREPHVEVAAPSAFEKDPALLAVEAVLWRGEDGVLAEADARDGGLRMPAATLALADFAFAADDAEPRQLTYVSLPGGATFYRWQARMTFAPEPGVDSPAQIWSAPHETSSADLDLFPAVLTPCRRLSVRLGAGHDDSLEAVRVDVVASSPGIGEIARRTLTVDHATPAVEWAVRRSAGTAIVLEETRTYRYAGGRHVTLPPAVLVDPELVVNSPFAAPVELTPIVSGGVDTFREVVLAGSYDDPATGYRAEERVRLPGPAFDPVTLVVPVLRSGDTVRWQASGVGPSGVVEIARGLSRTGTLDIVVGNDRPLRVEWLGRALADEGLRWVKVTVRVRDGGGAVVQSAVVEWTDRADPDPVTVRVPLTGRVDYVVERRTSAGRSTDPAAPVVGDVITVLP